jgi:formate hydrogenlyase subunit 3/multisubunit Na+/H+ antiporter MnhD subunit
MNTILFYPIAIPIFIGLICLLTRQQARGWREALLVVTTIASLALSIFLFVQPDLSISIRWLQLTPGLVIGFDLHTSAFARFTLVVIASFSLLAGLYSLPFMRSHLRHREYYAYFLMALGVTSGAVLAGNLVLLLFFWELHGFLLFLMAGLNGDPALRASTRTLMIAGVGDLTLMLGIGLLWTQTGSLSINPGPTGGAGAGSLSALALAPSTPTLGAAFVLMAIGAFAKGGIMPLHTWIPAISTETPMTVMGYFTSLDKMLGFYLLTVLSLQIFDVSGWAGWFLMTIGAVTLLGGVLMAVIQKDFRRMLAFHSISQVGYMLVGIGTGSAIGIVGGLFHLLNMIIVKGSLYLCGGSVQYRTGKTKFDELGGLAKAMPWTFVSTLIASLAIAGVPPLNAFVSKWMVYQGIIERGGAAFPIFLLVAMFGSALTLASFMKLLYSIFWGDKPAELGEVKESPWTMAVPIFLLGLLAIGFGVFYQWPVTALLTPILGAGAQVSVIGLWNSNLATLLLIASLLVGLVIYWAGRPRRSVEADVFLGGEALDPEIYRVPGTHFYGPVKNMDGLKQAYAMADHGSFDLYLQGTILTRRISRWVYKYIDQALADFYQEVIPALLSLIGEILHVLNARMVLTRILWGLYALGGLAILFMPNQYEIITLTRVIACVGMIGWAFLAWVETDLQRMLVLAATSQLGFVVLGITLSSGVAVSYLATGSIALLVLFAVAYFIRRNMHTTEIDQMSGLAGKMPVAFVFFVLAALWLSGLPPFGSFFSKFLLGVAAGEISPFLTIAITGAAILTLAYLLRPIRKFLGSK